jgi:hypothetical protein
MCRDDEATSATAPSLPAMLLPTNATMHVALLHHSPVVGSEPLETAASEQPNSSRSSLGSNRHNAPRNSNRKGGAHDAAPAPAAQPGKGAAAQKRKWKSVTMIDLLSDDDGREGHNEEGANAQRAVDDGAPFDDADESTEGSSADQDVD